MLEKPWTCLSSGSRPHHSFSKSIIRAHFTRNTLRRWASGKLLAASRLGRGLTVKSTQKAALDTEVLEGSYGASSKASKPCLSSGHGLT